MSVVLDSELVFGHFVAEAPAADADARWFSTVRS